MAKHAVGWAEKNGLDRVSPIHGEKEYKIVAEESFTFRDLNRTSQRASSSTLVEA